MIEGVPVDGVRIDERRLAQFIKAALVTHPEQEKVKRYQLGGAALCVRVDSETELLEVKFQYTAQAAELRARRADYLGIVPQRPQGDDIVNPFVLARTPVASLQSESET